MAGLVNFKNSGLILIFSLAPARLWVRKFRAQNQKMEAKKLNKNNLFFSKPNAKDDAFPKTKNNVSFLLQMRERKLILLFFFKKKTMLSFKRRNKPIKCSFLFHDEIKEMHFQTSTKKKMLSLSEMKCKNSKTNVFCSKSNEKRKWVEEMIAWKCSFEAVYPFQKLKMKCRTRRRCLI